MSLAASATPSAGSGLQRLLELEANLDARLAEVRREAEQLRGEALTAATGIRAGGEERIRAEDAALVARVEAERVRSAEELRAELAREAAHYGDLGAARIETIARGLLSLLLAPGGAP
jgi:hypothetical protein